MNGLQEFNELFFQYRGVEFTLNGIDYYMHMNCPTKGCAIDKKDDKGEWMQDFYKFSNLEEMTHSKLFDGKTFIELLENTDIFEDLFYI